MPGRDVYLDGLLGHGRAVGSPAPWRTSRG